MTAVADLGGLSEEALERIVLGLNDDADASPPPCRAAEVSADDDPWFAPEPGPRARRERAGYEAQARRLCGSCPVRGVCLELALRYEDRGLAAWGVWGGTAPWTRRSMLRARRNGAAVEGAVA